MSALEALLVAVAPALAKLLESALADTYDKAAELQAILEMQRAAADAREARQLAQQE